MEKQIITFSANEQKLQKTSGIDCYASNTVAYIEAHFDLGENWSGYDSVRAVWWNDYNKTVATVLDSDGTCIVPYEVLARKSAVKVNLVGSIAENDVLTDRLTTCPVIALTIKCNAKTDGDNTQPITPSEYEQFVAEVKEDADRAEAGAESAEASAQSASESATASANSASDSAQSATASAQSAQNASGSAQSAENAKDDAEDARDEILGMRATAETLEAGSDATASYSDGLLTLGIPRGDKGEQGIQGETGATPSFSIGTVETLEPTEDATATITGTAENPVLNMGIPKGEQGDVTRSEFNDLKSDATSVAQGYQPVYDAITWKNGYISLTGSIFNDTGAQFGIIELQKGDLIKVSTRLKNCSIISSTTEDSLSVGDSATPIVTTTQDLYQTFSYVAISDIKVVIGVRKSEYSIQHLTKGALMKTADVEKDYTKNYRAYSLDLEGQRVRPTDGGWSYQDGYYRTDHIACASGDRVEYKGRSAWYNGECLTALLAFYDSEKHFISAITQFGSETTNTTGELDVTAPTGAAYLRACSYTIEDDFGIRVHSLAREFDELKDAVKNIHYDETKNVITTVLGAELPDNVTSEYGVSSAYASKMKEAINDWMSEYAGDAMKVPFILHTDQHGRLTSAKKGIFDLLSYLVNWNEVSAIFNLGDTVVNNWTDDSTNTNPLLRNATLEDAIKCLSSVPVEKQINVYGNHDTWYNGTVSTPVSGTLPSMQYNNPYFIADGLRTVVLPDNSGFMAVYDDKRKIKYLVLAGWDYADKATEKPNDYTGYQWYWINQKHLNWIVSEMSKNEGYDLVLVSHVALCLEDGIAVNPISGSALSLDTPEYIVHWDNYLNTLWNARKNKTSGSVSTGLISASFDFTNCTDNCLCAIAGHTHTDAIEYVGNANNGLLGVVFDWFADDTIHFGIIDRRNECIKAWKLSNTNSTPTVENWQKPFNK